MDKSFFRYIWRHSGRDQVMICAVVAVSLPFYYLSLDLPRRIVNEAIQGSAFRQGNETVPFLKIAFDLPAWLGRAHIHIMDGISVGRIGLLFCLSFTFLFFVLVNGAFKYWINLAKGALGERMLRRMRFELFNLILRFRPEALKRVKAAETATIIKDEVEPIGGFIGDAFILPMLLGAQAATALVFIIIQNEWLGLAALAMVGVQLIVIPRLRRKLLTLGRQRQLASRQFAGRIGEVFDGQETVRLLNTADWERAEIGDRLYELFNIRYQIYKRKFVVKFLNNLLAQMTPFLFYAVGGYFAVTGRMDIGQLVAVIGAYRDLPPPLKELIDWDQQRLDVQIKYDQIVQQFAPDRLLPEESPQKIDNGDAVLGTPLSVTQLKISDGQGGSILDGISFEVPLPCRMAVIGRAVGQASALARILARPDRCVVGRITAGTVEMTALSASRRSREIGYVSSETALFPGTIRDNLVYGLKFRHVGTTEEIERLRLKRQAEAQKTGNPLERADDLWIDYAQAGADGREDLDRILLSYLHEIGLGEDIYRFGQAQALDPKRYPVFAERLIGARRRLHERLQAQQAEYLVEGFDPNRYNTQASIAENLLFGVPAKKELKGGALAAHPGFIRVLKKERLTDILIGFGGHIASTMVEIFRELTPGHPLFEQFSFINADELDEYNAIVARWDHRRASVSRAERAQLVALALNYIEPKHRLGLLDDTLRKQIVAARSPMRDMLKTMEPGGIEFYAEDKICSSAPLRDNILFGRINAEIADARSKVAEALHAVIEELDLRHPVERLGLNQQVGTSGRLLTVQQRAGINLVRNLVKRPKILVVDGAFVSFSPQQKDVLRTFLLRYSSMLKTMLVMSVSDESELQGFDFAVTLSSNHATVEKLAPPGEPDRAAIAGAEIDRSGKEA